MTSEDQKKQIKSELVYERLSLDDLLGLSDLISGMNKDSREMYRIRSQSAEYYRWMYFKNPAGNASVFCAKHNGKIVSSFAMAPKKIQVGDKVVNGGKTMDMFTHPNYQGMGLMSRLGNMVFEDAKKRGIEFWYVTPSLNSYPIFMKKWGYVEKFELLFLVKIINSAEIIKSYTKSNFIKKMCDGVYDSTKKIIKILRVSSQKYEIEELKQFDHETDSLWEQSRKPGCLSLSRESKYMNWRYFENPDDYRVLAFRKNGNMCGLVVIKITLRKGLFVGEIVDFFCLPQIKSIFQDMITSIANELSQKCCALLQTWVFENSWMESDMKKVGLKIKRRKLKILMSPESPYPEIYNKDLWFFTQGDGNDI